MLILLSQRWFQVVLAIVLIIGVLVGVYFWGKSNGRTAAATEFDKRQAELLKKSQEADARADMWKAKAESSEFYASKLSEDLLKDRKTAALNQKIYEQAYNEEQQEITKKYEADKNYINSDLPACVRCNDLCRRAEELAKYGPEFANAKCNPSSCADACASQP